jgi:hypothetical protein
MISEAHSMNYGVMDARQVRLVEEHRQLQERIEKISGEIGRLKLNDVCGPSLDMLTDQRDAMGEYLFALEERMGTIFKEEI